MTDSDVIIRANIHPDYVTFERRLKRWHSIAIKFFNQG